MSINEFLEPDEVLDLIKRLPDNYESDPKFCKNFSWYQAYPVDFRLMIRSKKGIVKTCYVVGIDKHNWLVGSTEAREIREEGKLVGLVIADTYPPISEFNYGGGIKVEEDYRDQFEEGWFEKLK